MAAAGGDTSTVVDGLKKVFPQISSLLLAQDADKHQQFIQGLMSAIQKYLTQAAQSTITGGGGPAAPGQPPGQGAPPSPGGAPGGNPLPGQPAGIPSGGGMQGLAGAMSRNPDEVRRLLTTTTNP